MNSSEFNNLFKTAFQQYNLSFNETISRLFQIYILELSRLSYNLTAIHDTEEIIINHFLDSLSLLSVPDFTLNNKKIIDIGSGAGFPLMPLKIVNPEFEAVFIDRKQKSISFLQHLAQKMNLHSCIFSKENIQEMKNSPLYKEQFDIIVSRAVGSIGYMIKNSLFLLKKQGILILYKGPKYQEEINDLKTSEKKKISRIEIKPVAVPFLKKERNLIFIYK